MKDFFHVLTIGTVASSALLPHSALALKSSEECQSIYDSMGLPGDGGVCFDDAGSCNPKCKEIYTTLIEHCKGVHISMPGCGGKIGSQKAAFYGGAYFQRLCLYPDNKINPRDSYNTCGFDFKVMNKGSCQESLLIAAGAALSHECSEKHVLDEALADIFEPVPQKISDSGCGGLCVDALWDVRRSCNEESVFFNILTRSEENFSYDTLLNQLDVVQAFFGAPVSKMCYTMLDEMFLRTDVEMKAHQEVDGLPFDGSDEKAATTSVKSAPAKRNTRGKPRDGSSVALPRWLPFALAAMGVAVLV